LADQEDIRTSGKKPTGDFGHGSCAGEQVRLSNVAENPHSYERTYRFSKMSDGAKGRGRDVLVVRLRPLQKPAVLRWFAQGHDLWAEEDRDRRGKDGGVVRVQALKDVSVL